MNAEIIPFRSVHNKVKRSDGTAHGTTRERHVLSEQTFPWRRVLLTVKPCRVKQSIIVCDEWLKTGSKCGSVRIMRLKMSITGSACSSVYRGGVEGGVLAVYVVLRWSDVH